MNESVTKHVTEQARLSIIKRLGELADLLDDEVAAPSRMKLHHAYKDVARDADKPPRVEMDPASVALAERSGWYMSEKDMVQELDTRGVLDIELLGGRRIERVLGQAFQNPYGATGLTGPGVLGVFKSKQGPLPENRAVDVIPYFINAQQRLSFFGIRRSPADENQPGFNGGFNEGLAFENAVREFIEESVAASALPQMAKNPRGAVLLDAWQKAENTGQTAAFAAPPLAVYGIRPGFDAAEVAFHWLLQEDQSLIAELTALFKRDKIDAYQGPVRADRRNTDSRWIGTEAFACFFPEYDLKELLGTHGLCLKAGSDASSTAVYNFGSDFVLSAYASHGPILMHAFGKVLSRHRGLPTEVLNQAEELVRDIERHLGVTPAAKAAPGPQTPRRTSTALAPEPRP